MLYVFVVTAVVALSPTVAHADSAGVVNSPDGVNLRAAPSTAAPVLTVLPSGAAVTVTGDANVDGWLPVTANGKSGFVKAEFVTAAPSAPAPTPAPVAVPAPTPTDPVAPQYAIVTSPDGLNIRRGPGTSFGLVVAVPGGARVQVFGPPNPDGWYSVSYNSRSGWVDGKFIAMTGQSVNLASAASAPSPVQTATPPATARWIWPTASRRISTTFSSWHPGIDIDEFQTGSSPVAAMAAGKVSFAGGPACCSYGLHVIVTHADGFTTLYSHLNSIDVREGQEVRQGTKLGMSGCTGRCTGIHVHLEVRKDGVALDPLTLLPGPYSIE